MIRFLNLLFITFFLTACACNKPKNQDLDFIYQTIVDNHPGIYNKQDPNFRHNLEVAHRKAQKALRRNSDIIKERQIIKTFANSFNDSHLWVSYYSDQVKNSPLKKKLENFEINYLNKQVVWLTLPTFDLDKKQQQDFNKILKELPKSRNKGLIVFDLRGNEGGNSEYGSKIVNILFGEKYAQQRRYMIRKNIFVDWRVSQDNLKHMHLAYERYKSPWIKDIIEGLKEGLQHGRTYYKEASTEDLSERNTKNLTHFVTAKIIVIIDSGNFSAALDFIDELKMMGPEITLAGEKTKADRVYMEARNVDLPSGLGRFTFPIKVYRNRLREDNVPYEPDIKYDVTDQKKLEKFIMDIENK